MPNWDAATQLCAIMRWNADKQHNVRYLQIQQATQAHVTIWCSKTFSCSNQLGCQLLSQVAYRVLSAGSLDTSMASSD